MEFRRVLFRSSRRRGRRRGFGLEFTEGGPRTGHAGGDRRMQQERIEPLVEAIYDASLDPAGWARAMALVRESFETGAACIYSLDYQRRRMRPVEVGNIAPRFLGSLEASFYTDANQSARTPTRSEEHTS